MRYRYFKTVDGRLLKREGKHRYFMYAFQYDVWCEVNTDVYKIPELREISDAEAMLELL